MTCGSFFKNAKWVGASERKAEDFFVLRSKFSLSSVRNVTINVLGLGFFKCYVNGVCVNPDTFLPLSSDYESGCDPEGELLRSTNTGILAEAARTVTRCSAPLLHISLNICLE